MYNYFKNQLTYNKLQGLFLLSDINMGDYLIIKFLWDTITHSCSTSRVDQLICHYG